MIGGIGLSGSRLLASVSVILALAATSCTSGVAATSHPRRPASSQPPAEVAQLPVDLPTKDAQQVITVAANSLSSTTATLQAWQRSLGGSWVRFGAEVEAHLGRAGIALHERESLAATPEGSFTLTQAFGRLPDPGSRLPYFQTTPSDWWISQPGPLYNTHQTCVTSCAFRAGTPNARLFFVTPQYNLAVVIDYNRFPVVQGAGSGIFLHVTTGRPTNGCVSIPMQNLVSIMRWLQPDQHPRILIGVATNGAHATASPTR